MTEQFRDSGRRGRANTVSRRGFGRLLVGAAAAAAVPLFVPARLLGAQAPSNRLRVGQIGCGRIAQVHDVPSVLKSGLADYVAVCDLDSSRAADSKEQLAVFYRKSATAAPDVQVYSNYRGLLAHPDLDAVLISTPGHWHAQLVAAAILAGKDVYVQKPFTITVAEGILLRDLVAKTGRIVQVGSQQRSTPQFRLACELVRSGRIGRVRRVEIGLPIDPTQPDDPQQPVPVNLQYDAWLGSTPQVYYTEQRVHPQKGYGRPGWLRNESYCLGMITGWGSHHYDTLHWALNTELSGPSRVEARADFPHHKIWNVHGAYPVDLQYPDDVRVSVSDKHPNGLKFIGDEGWIWVTREGQTTASDPGSRGTTLPPLDASDPRLLAPEGLSVQLPRSDEHHKNWLESVRAPLTVLNIYSRQRSGSQPHPRWPPTPEVGSVWPYVSQSVSFFPHCPLSTVRMECVPFRALRVITLEHIMSGRSVFKSTNLLACAALMAATAAQATEVAPYFHTWGFGSNSYKANSRAAAKSNGVTAVTLAFGVSGGGCTLGGGLEVIMNDAGTKADVKQFIAQGGKVILSFGGADGQYLESACSETGMYNLVKNVMTAQNIHNLDFDVEGSQLDNTALNTTRNNVIKRLQADFPDLYVSFTLPVDTTGLPGDALTLLESAHTAGVNVSVVNVMTMDYGSDNVGGRTMGSVAVSSAQGTQQQLKAIFTGRTDAQLC